MLNEAAKQLNRNGFSLTSLSEIANTLNVSRRALYHYIEDREDLVYQCYVRSCEVVGERLREASANSDDALAIVDRLIDLVLAPDQPELCAISELGLLPETKQADVERRYEAVVKRLAAILEAGERNRGVRPCDFDIAARSILGVILWLPLADPWSTPLPPRPQQIATAKAFIRDGWAPEPRRLPDYEPIDVEKLEIRAFKGFDRDALADAKREQILAAASRLFNRKGIDSTGLREIGAELGVSTRVIDHNIGSKQTLVAECYFRMMRMALALEQYASAIPSQSKLAGIASVQHSWALAQMRDDLSPLNPTTGFHAMSGEDRARFLDYSKQLVEAAARYLERNGDDDELRGADVNMFRLHVGVTAWLARSSMTDPAEQEAAARETAAFITVGIRSLTD